MDTRKLFCLLAAPFVMFTELETNAKEDGGTAEIEQTEVVPSGTYTGTAHKVDPKEKEIYVKTPDGKILELYFSDDTELLQGEKPAGFDALKEGQQLEVKVEKKGDTLKPVRVKIMGGSGTSI